MHSVSSTAKVLSIMARIDSLAQVDKVFREVCNEIDEVPGSNEFVLVKLAEAIVVCFPAVMPFDHLVYHLHYFRIKARSQEERSTGLNSHYLL